MAKASEINLFYSNRQQPEKKLRPNGNARKKNIIFNISNHYLLWHCWAHLNGPWPNDSQSVNFS
jgi:hypothetical protein